MKEKGAAFGILWLLLEQDAHGFCTSESASVCLTKQALFTRALRFLFILAVLPSKYQRAMQWTEKYVAKIFLAILNLLVLLEA